MIVRNDNAFRSLKRILVQGILLVIFIHILGCNAQSRLISGKETIVETEELNYYLYYPPEYQQQDTTMGLLLFLHGGGESGQELNALQQSGPPKLLEEGMDFPFLILAPQNPYPRKWWNTRALKKLLDKIVKENRVDPNRLYLSGLSRGGGAAWEMAVQYPDTFAALAVVCGMAPLPYASWIDKDLPIWVFHGTEDPSIPFAESEQMVDKLRAMGYDVQFTVYEGAGHNVWDLTYTTPELYSWMAAQTKDME